MSLSHVRSASIGIGLLLGNVHIGLVNGVLDNILLLRLSALKGTIPSHGGVTR